MNVRVFLEFFSVFITRTKKKEKQSFNEIRIQFEIKKLLKQNLLKTGFIYPRNRESLSLYI